MRICPPTCRQANVQVRTSGLKKLITDSDYKLYAKVDNVINISRNDFRPPSQVESSVIRLVPLDPPPPVEFQEFDGMNKVIFPRPNKTISKGVMKMLEQNRRTWVSAQEMVYITHSYFQGLWRRFPYSPTDVHLFQPVDSDTSIRQNSNGSWSSGEWSIQDGHWRSFQVREQAYRWLQHLTGCCLHSTT